MKKFFLLTLLALVNFTIIYSQEDPEKMIKKAVKAFNTFNVEQTAKGASLDEAKSIIDQVFQAEAMKSNVSAQLAKGQIYSGFISRDQTAKL